MTDRRSMKATARSLCLEAQPSPLLAGLFFALLALVVSTLSARLMGGGITAREMNHILEAYSGGDYEAALTLIARYRPSGGATLIDTALQIVMMLVSAGFTMFLLNTIRGTGAVFGNLLDGFGIAGRVILLNLLESVIIFLWSLLFIIPGIIAAYRYRQAIYILIDHPEKSVLECLRESKAMMDGRKGELFMLDLSMIGWLLLDTFVPFAAVWTAPYTGMVYGLYYESLRLPEREEPFTFDPEL